MRRSSVVPRSHSWLPTDETSRPMALRTSMVGSSLKTLDSNGEALIRSPAPTNHAHLLPPLAPANALFRFWTVAATCRRKRVVRARHDGPRPPDGLGLAVVVDEGGVTAGGVGDAGVELVHRD